MRTKSLTQAMRLSVLTAALGLVACVDGCVERLSVTAVAEPSVIVMGEGAVSLKGEIGSNAKVVDLEWRLARRPEGSEFKLPPVHEAVASFTPDVPGDYEFQFTATGGSARSGGGLASGVGGRPMASTRVKVTVVRRPVGMLGFLTQPSEVAAGSAFEPSVSVELKTDEGDIILEPIGITLSLRGGTQGAQLMGTRSVTTVDGVATFADLSVDLVGTGYTFEATAGGMTSDESEAFAVVAGAADISKSTLVAAPTLLKSDGQATSMITLSLKDAYDNPAAGRDVLLEVTGTGHMFAGGDVKTDAQGQYSTTLSSTSAGTKTVTATFDTPEQTLSADVTFLQEIPSASHSDFYVPDMLIADGETEEQISVVLRGDNGNYAPGVPVTFSSAEPADAFSERTVTTGEDGMATVTLKSTKAGRRELKASFGQETLTASMLFRAGAPVAENSSFTANPTTIPADDETQSTLTVVLKDKYENPVSGEMVTISSDAETGGYSYTGEILTDENGVATSTLTSGVTDALTLTATVWRPGDAPLEMSATVNFTLAAPVIYELYISSEYQVTSACLHISFEVGQLQGKPVTVRFQYRDESGRLQNATPLYEEDGNETTGTEYYWNAEADVKGWESESVTLVATPFIDVTGEELEGAPFELKLGIARTFERPETFELKGVLSANAWNTYNATSLVCSVNSPPSLVSFDWDWEKAALLSGEPRALEAEEAPAGVRVAFLNSDGALDEVLWFAGAGGKPGWLQVRLSEQEGLSFRTIDRSEISPTAVFTPSEWGSEGRVIVVVGTEQVGDETRNVVAYLEVLSDSVGDYIYVSREMRAPLTGVTAGRLDWEIGHGIVVTDDAGDVHVFSPGDGAGFEMASFKSGMKTASMPVLVNPPSGSYAIFTASSEDMAVSVVDADAEGVFRDGVVVAPKLAAAPVGLESGDFIPGQGGDQVLLVLESGDVHLFQYVYDYTNESVSMHFVERVTKVASGVSSVAVGDFNGDYAVDFATTHPAADMVTVVYGTRYYSECSPAL